MTQKNLKQEMRELICEITELDEIADDANFKELGIDSMTAIEIISALERKYGIQVPEADLVHVTTLNKSYELVSRKLAEKGAVAQA